MSKLIQIPVLGDWLDPNSVREITTNANAAGAWVEVETDDTTHTIPCPNVREAESLRDRLATMVNAERDE